MKSYRIELLSDGRVCCAAARGTVMTSLIGVKHVAEVIELSTRSPEGARLAGRIGATTFPTLLIDGCVRVDPPLTPDKVRAALDRLANPASDLDTGGEPRAGNTKD